MSGFVVESKYPGSLVSFKVDGQVERSPEENSWLVVCKDVAGDPEVTAMMGRQISSLGNCFLEGVPDDVILGHGMMLYAWAVCYGESGLLSLNFACCGSPGQLVYTLQGHLGWSLIDFLEKSRPMRDRCNVAWDQLRGYLHNGGIPPKDVQDELAYLLRIPHGVIRWG